MNVLSWNCRELGRPSAVRGLRGLIQSSSPWGLFLFETKVKMVKMKRIVRSLHYDHSHFVEARNGAGGLALLWKDGYDWDVFFSSD